MVLKASVNEEVKHFLSRFRLNTQSTSCRMSSVTLTDICCFHLEKLLLEIFHQETNTKVDSNDQTKLCACAVSNAAGADSTVALISLAASSYTITAVCAGSRFYATAFFIRTALIHLVFGFDFRDFCVIASIACRSTLQRFYIVIAWLTFRNRAFAMVTL